MFTNRYYIGYEFKLLVLSIRQIQSRGWLPKRKPFRIHMCNERRYKPEKLLCPLALALLYTHIYIYILYAACKRVGLYGCLTSYEYKRVTLFAHSIHISIFIWNKCVYHNANWFLFDSFGFSGRRSTHSWSAQNIHTHSLHIDPHNSGRQDMNSTDSALTTHKFELERFKLKLHT